MSAEQEAPQPVDYEAIARQEAQRLHAERRRKWQTPGI
jgi:hypothetical protein